MVILSCKGFTAHHDMSHGSSPCTSIMQWIIVQSIHVQCHVQMHRSMKSFHHSWPCMSCVHAFMKHVRDLSVRARALLQLSTRASLRTMFVLSFYPFDSRLTAHLNKTILCATAARVSSELLHLQSQHSAHDNNVQTYRASETGPITDVARISRGAWSGEASAEEGRWLAGWLAGSRPVTIFYAEQQNNAQRAT